MKRKILQGFLLTSILVSMVSCGSGSTEETSTDVPFDWNNANVYFLLTDRFANGDPGNDINFGRSGETAVMRGYLGGDIAGVRQKLEEGYFDELGITALWMTPWFEQNRGSTDEGTGTTYAYHGYWTQDWTSLDPNVGSREELAKLIESARERGIRVVMDVIINHTGPVTAEDPVWPADWVRTEPTCAFTTYENTTRCALVDNLPDIRTESDQEVELPAALLEKWETEGRLEQELAELEAFFQRTGYPRAPRYYIIKWLCDYIREYGIDAFRLDTAKHIEEWVWKELYREASLAYEEWKSAHPEEARGREEFYMLGEVYGYAIGNGRNFNFGDTLVDFFAQDIRGMINFAFKSDAGQDYETLFSSYSDILHTELEGQVILNYLSSHDDHHPYDPLREKSLEAATRLLLAPGGSQVYYGDESARILRVEGAEGDAHLRSPMNWEELEDNAVIGGVTAGEVYAHYCKLGQFRKAHPAVGAGRHQILSREPYVFSRVYRKGSYVDRVVVGLDMEAGLKRLDVAGLFEDGAELVDHYSGQKLRVRKGMVEVDSPDSLVLLGKP